MMQSLVIKKFVLYFNPEFAGGERLRFATIEFFTDDRGFRERNIKDINNMKLDDTINIGPLKIWRVV